MLHEDGHRVEKAVESTFFPDERDEAKVMQEIRHAMDNPVTGIPAEGV